MRKTQCLTDDIDALLTFRPALSEAATGDSLNASVTSGNGGISVTTNYPRALEDFFARLDISELHDFDYDPFAVKDRLDDPGHIPSATLDELRAVLTYMLRSERFCEGSWGKFLHDGMLMSALERLAAIRAEIMT